LLKKHRHEMKAEAVWQIECGGKLAGSDVATAMARHGEFMERFRGFLEQYEFLVCAVNQLPPFDAAINWPKEIEGVAMENYLSWMKSAYWITPTFCPAISVPAGFTDDGLPVGIQIVGRNRDDYAVLQIAHAFEQATGFGSSRPAVALT
jgi:amidase